MPSQGRESIAILLTLELVCNPLASRLFLSYFPEYYNICHFASLIIKYNNCVNKKRSSLRTAPYFRKVGLIQRTGPHLVFAAAAMPAGSGVREILLGLNFQGFQLGGCGPVMIKI